MVYFRALIPVFFLVFFYYSRFVLSFPHFCTGSNRLCFTDDTVHSSAPGCMSQRPGDPDAMPLIYVLCVFYGNYCIFLKVFFPLNKI